MPKGRAFGISRTTRYRIKRKSAYYPQNKRKRVYANELTEKQASASGGSFASGAGCFHGMVFVVSKTEILIHAGWDAGMPSP